MNLLTSSKKLIPSLQIPSYITRIFKGLQLLSHSLTTYLAAKLFVTPLRFKTPKREQYMDKSAQKSKMYVANIQKEIQILSYGYSKKKILLVHGWSGRSTQLFAFADKLLENGYMVISFDGPAHGMSDGKTAPMPEFLETIKEIESKFGPFDAAIGHSFGGFCLLNSVANHLQLKSLVTVGASDVVSDVLRNFTNSLGLKSIISKKLKTYFDKKWQQDINYVSSSLQAKQIKTPTLVVHDSQDGDVAVSCAQNIRQNLQNGTLFITNGLGHTKILRNTLVVNRVVQFIKQNQ